MYARCLRKVLFRSGLSRASLGLNLGLIWDLIWDLKRHLVKLICDSSEHPGLGLVVKIARIPDRGRVFALPSDGSTDSFAKRKWFRKVRLTADKRCIRF